MEWASKDGSWELAKYTDLRFPSNNPIVLETDLHLFIKKSAKLLVLTQGSRTLHQVPLREPFPVIKFRDLSFYVSLKINQSDIRFRFRTKSLRDSKDITNSISQYSHVQEHTRSRGRSQTPLFSQDPVTRRQFKECYDAFGSLSSADSLSSPRLTQSPTPPLPNNPYHNVYGRVDDVHLPYKPAQIDQATQTERPSYSSMTAIELEQHLNKLMDCRSFQNLLINTRTALSRMNKADINKIMGKYRRQNKTASTHSSQADSILHRF